MGDRTSDDEAGEEGLSWKTWRSAEQGRPLGPGTWGKGGVTLSGPGAWNMDGAARSEPTTWDSWNGYGSSWVEAWKIERNRCGQLLLPPLAIGAGHGWQTMATQVQERWPPYAWGQAI